jgi:hypothetical protein
MKRMSEPKKTTEGRVKRRRRMAADMLEGLFGAQSAAEPFRMTPEGQGALESRASGGPRMSEPTDACYRCGLRLPGPDGSAPSVPSGWTEREWYRALREWGQDGGEGCPACDYDHIRAAGERREVGA